MIYDKDGKIIRATELELLALYTAHRGSASMTFGEFKRSLLRSGTVIEKSEKTEK